MLVAFATCTHHSSARSASVWSSALRPGLHLAGEAGVARTARPAGPAWCRREAAALLPGGRRSRARPRPCSRCRCEVLSSTALANSEVIGRAKTQALAAYRPRGPGAAVLVRDVAGVGVDQRHVRRCATTPGRRARRRAPCARPGRAAARRSRPGPGSSRRCRAGAIGVGAGVGVDFGVSLVPHPVSASTATSASTAGATARGRRVRGRGGTGAWAQDRRNRRAGRPAAPLLAGHLDSTIGRTCPDGHDPHDRLIPAPESRPKRL